VEKIGKGMYDAARNSWSVVCDDKGRTSALIFTFDEKYISIKPKNCYYTMFMFI
jgi:hypothetical protein